MSLLTSIRSSFKSSQQAVPVAAPVEEVTVPVVEVAKKYLSTNEGILAERNEGVKTQIEDCKENLAAQLAANKALALVLAESKVLAEQVPLVRAELLTAFQAQATLELEMEEALLAFKDLGL